jgi:hypothetical protein
VPLPELSEGPHLGYAAQWFIFSMIALVGYPLVLRRVVQRRGREVDDGSGAGDAPVADDADADADAGNADDPAASGGRDLDDELRDLLRKGG